MKRIICFIICFALCLCGCSEKEYVFNRSVTDKESVVQNNTKRDNIVPDLGAFLNCKAVLSYNVDKEACGDGSLRCYQYYANDASAIDEYTKLLTDKYNFKWYNYSGTEPYDANSARNFLFRFEYVGEHKVDDFTPYYKEYPGDLFIKYEVYNNNQYIKAYVVYSNDLIYSDEGERCSKPVKDYAGKTFNNSNSTKGQNSSASSGNKQNGTVITDDGGSKTYNITFDSAGNAVVKEKSNNNAGSSSKNSNNTMNNGNSVNKNTTTNTTKTTQGNSGSKQSSSSTDDFYSREKKKDETCWKCDGNGRRECGVCGGEGYIETFVSTPNYSGSIYNRSSKTVRKRCTSLGCLNGDVKCSVCGGDGKI